jgi:hypothetical protein
MLFRWKIQCITDMYLFTMCLTKNVCGISLLPGINERIQKHVQLSHTCTSSLIHILLFIPLLFLFVSTLVTNQLWCIYVHYFVNERAIKWHGGI